MTTDEVKVYLWQVHKLDIKLQRARMDLDKLRSAVEYRSPSFDGAGGHGSDDKIGLAMARIIEYATQVDVLTEEYTAKYDEIKKAVGMLENDNLEQLLELRYLHYLKWEDIAQRMSYSDRQTLRLHGVALKKMQKMLKMSPNVIECHT